MFMWDFIDKHINNRKTCNGKWFMDPNCEYVKNEIPYFNARHY